MKGHEVVIKMRMVDKIKPPAVFLNDYEGTTGFLDAESKEPHVCVAMDDIGGLDLRFLVGIDVRVTGSSEKRTRELFDACIAEGANSVAACQINPDGSYMEDFLVLVWSKEEEMIHG